MSVDFSPLKIYNINIINEDRLREEVEKVQKDVVVSICTTFALSKSFGPFEIEEDIEGKIYFINDKALILSYPYNINGKFIQNSIKLEGSKLSQVSVGDVHRRSSFTSKNWGFSNVYYEKKEILLKTYTHKLDYEVTPFGGLIDIIYDIRAENEILGTFNIEWLIQDI